MEKLDKKNIEDILALTPMQEGMLFHYLKDPENDHYFEQLSLEISGEIDGEIFQKAWNFVIETNEMLRTVFRWEKLEKSMQIILKEHKLQSIFYDVSDKDGDKRKKLLSEIKVKDRKTKFNLQQVPFRVTLCRIEKDKYEMIISNHHILYDGWSNGIILKEFFKAYNDFSAGKELLRPVKTRFREFVKCDQDRETGEQEKFWQEYLKGFDTRTELPIKIKNRGKGIKTAGSYKVRFSRVVSEKLESFVKQHKLTMASLLYSVWGLLLQRYNNCEDVVFGTTVSGRSAKIKGIEDMVGLFINTLPSRVQSPADGRAVDVLYRVERMLLARKEYECTSLVDIKEYSEIDNKSELFDFLVVLENYPIYDRLKGQKGRLALRSYSMFEMTHYALTLQITLFDDIEMSFNYNKVLLAESTIAKLAHDFMTVTQDIINHPGRMVSEIDILSEEEKNRILCEFNDTKSDYPRDKTIRELFEDQVEKVAARIAVVYQDNRLSYEELNDRANRLASRLRQKGVTGDTVVGVLAERSLEMITGIFAILIAAGAYLPIDTGYPYERIRYISEDSGLKLVLTQGALGNQLGNIPGVEVLDLLDFNLYSAEGKHLAAVNSPAHLAYVIYTSGSTGIPKGVMIDHRSVTNLLFGLQEEYPFRESDLYLLKTSYVFDVSVTELFGWILGRGKLAIIGQDEGKDLQEILNTIERLFITHINFVPSMFKAFIELLNHENIQKLSALKYIFLAGEALLPDLVNQFRRLNSSVILENIYGPTEAAVYASKYSLGQWENSDHIPIGTPLPEVKLYILDRFDRLQLIGITGELCIGGTGLGRGYLNRLELTAEKFARAVISHSSLVIISSLKTNDRSPLRHSPYSPYSLIYRTGDLARWLPDGNIEFLGRKDQQVKIRGYRLELEEIEKKIFNYHDHKIKDVVVVDREDKNGDKYLCAYIVSNPARAFDKTPSIVAALREYLSRELPDYMIPSYFVQVDGIPLIPSGKLDRKALPAPKITGQEKYTAPRSHVEQELVKIWSGVLGRSKNEEHLKIGIDDNFFTLGGHSLKVTALASRIHNIFDIKLPLTEVFRRPTVRMLSEYIKLAVREQYKPIELTEEKEYYPLSSAQKRLYFLQQMEESGIAYNMPSIWILKGDVDKTRMAETFGKQIQRHESLRTSFRMVNEVPVQLVPDDVKFEIEFFDFATEERGQTTENRPGTYLSSVICHRNMSSDFIRPFDLSQAPLFRVSLVKLEEEKHILMVDMHHIISDGISAGILVHEFITFYPGEELPEISLRYKDYAQWQERQKGSDNLLKQEEYWRKEFVGEIPVLELPTDDARPTVQQYEGSSLNFEINKEITGKLRAFTAETGVTLYMALLALYSIFLSKISSQEDIVIGTPVAGRWHADLEKIIGMFVNTLALRIYPSGEKKFTRLLEEVKQKTLNAFENQDYQYEDLVEVVSVTRDASRNPLFDTLFVLQNTHLPELKIPGLKLSPYKYENQTAKFDLTLVGLEIEDKLLFTFEYSTKLFKPETIEGFIEYFNKIVSVVSVAPTIKISEIEIVSEQERQQILFAFNETHASYPAAASLIQLFEAQVEKTPGKAALVSPSSSHRLTYRELNERSNRLGWLLREKGVGGNCIVGLMVERSVEMLLGILGIMKAGGAYLPIDVDYPPERVNYMLKDSQSPLFLTRSNLAESFNFNQELIDIEAACSRGENSNLGPINNPQDLVYMIYTSGSTGKPKGVMVKIEGFLNLLHWYIQEFKIGEEDNLLLVPPISFDLAQKNLFSPHLVGGCLTLASPGIPDYHELSEIIQKEQITIINCAPSVFYPLVEFNCDSDFMKLTSLREVVLGGESIQPDKLLPWVNSGFFECEIVNTYGPTECTDISACYRIPHETLLQQKRIIPIGKPIPNAKIFILDKYLKMLPVRIVGELYIGGIGLAKGYYNNSQLTREKFVEIPTLAERIVYRTGDLSRWLRDGNIEFLGRIDHQVKVRGLRIELAEIEHELLMHEDIKDAVVTARRNKNGDNYLYGYIVSGRELAVSELREYLGRQLPDYMIPSAFVLLERILLTPNGKINRNALPIPEIKSENEYLAPRTEIEERLAQIWSEVLGIEKERIGIQDNFFHLGGHSLKATLLISRIYKELNVNVPLAEIFKTPFISGLAGFIKNAEEHNFFPIDAVEKKEYCVLSSAQQRLYVLQQMYKSSTVYNVPTVLELKGIIVKERLEDTFKKLIIRHESLRTSFQLVKDEPVQNIHEDVDFEIEYYYVQGTGQLIEVRGEPGYFSEVEEIIRDFVRPFDLSCAPLLRAGLIEIEKDKHLLIVDMHHIITDAASHTILKKEFMVLYGEEELPPLELQYRDYSQWQTGDKQQEVLKIQENYWLKQFEGEIPLLDLPTDYSRSDIRDFEGRTVHFEISSEKSMALNKIAHDEGTTMFMVLLTIYYIFLSKICSQGDIIIGTDAAGRSHADMENIIGMFVNTLALRNFPTAEKSFKEFLQELKERTIKAFENQDYQFDDLVENVSPHKDAGRNPMFDVMFSFMDINVDEGEFQQQKNTDLILKNYTYENRTAKFDLMLNGREESGHLFLSFEYSTRLFKKETIEEYVTYFKEIVSSIIKNPYARIWEIEMVSEAEEKRLLEFVKEDQDRGLENMEEIQTVHTSSEADFDF